MPKLKRHKFEDVDHVLERIDSDDEYFDIIRHQPEVFAAIYHDYEIEPYQAQMMHWAREHSRSLIRVPAQHGKSSLMAKVFPEWEIVCNPNIRIILIMKTERDSKSYSEMIRNHLADESSLLAQHFGPFTTKNSGSWTVQEFNVAARQIKDPHFTMEFYGAGGPVLGHRTDLTIMDDVVTDETAKTEAQRKNQLSWFREAVQTGPRYLWPVMEIDPKEARDRLLSGDEQLHWWMNYQLGYTDEGLLRLLKVPEGIIWPRDIAYERIVVCGTSFHPKDLYFELQNDKTFADLYFDCYTHDPETGAIGALWPSQMSLAKLKREKESAGVLSFNKRFRNIALDEGELVFHEEFITGGTRDGVEYTGCLDHDASWGEFDEKWFRTFGLDPASGSTSRFSTWPSALCLGVEEDSPSRKMHILDIFREQMGIEDVISLILDGRDAGGIPGFFKLYKYHRGFIEANACQRWLLQHHRVKEAVDSRRVVLEPHYTGKNKWDELMGMSSLVRHFQNSNIMIPYKTPADQAKAQALIEQLVEFPKGIFDYVMALWFAILAAEAMLTQYESFYLPGHSGRMVKNPIYIDDDGSGEPDEEVFLSDRRKRLMGLL